MNSRRPTGPGGIALPADRPVRDSPAGGPVLPLRWPRAPREKLRWGAREKLRSDSPVQAVHESGEAVVEADRAPEDRSADRPAARDAAYRRLRRMLGRSYAHLLLVARETLHSLGGLATVEEVAGAAGSALRPVGENGTGSEGGVDDHFRSEVAEQPPLSDPPAFLRWIVELADDPSLRLRDDRYLVGPPIGAREYDRASARVEQLLRDEPSISVERIASELGRCWTGPGGDALRRRARLLGRLHGEEVAPDRFASGSRSLADWAERVLEEEGGPLHWREVARRVNQAAVASHDPTALRDVVGEDARFVRVGGGDYSLRAWGAEPYTRFAEVIERYLRRRDEPVHEDRITADLRRLYTLRPRTMISAMEEDPEVFRNFGDGNWGLVGVHSPRAR